MMNTRARLLQGLSQALNLDMMHHCIIALFDHDTKYWVCVVQPYPNRVVGGGEVAYCGHVNEDNVFRLTRVGPNLEFPTEVKFDMELA